MKLSMPDEKKHVNVNIVRQGAPDTMPLRNSPSSQNFDEEPMDVHIFPNKLIISVLIK